MSETLYMFISRQWYKFQLKFHPQIEINSIPPPQHIVEGDSNSVYQAGMGKYEGMKAKQKKRGPLSQDASNKTLEQLMTYCQLLNLKLMLDQKLLQIKPTDYLNCKCIHNFANVLVFSFQW